MSSQSLRSRLIRLAHANPSLRKDILPILENRTATTRSASTFRDGIHVFLANFQTEVTQAFGKIVNQNGLKILRRDYSYKGFPFGLDQNHLTMIYMDVAPPDRPRVHVSLENGDSKYAFQTAEITDLEPDAIAARIWKSIPDSFKE